MLGTVEFDDFVFPRMTVADLPVGLRTFAKCKLRLS